MVYQHTSLLSVWYQARGSFPRMLPHQGPHVAVDTIAAKHHVANFNTAIFELNFNSVRELCHIFDAGIRPDE